MTKSALWRRIDLLTSVSILVLALGCTTTRTTTKDPPARTWQSAQGTVRRLLVASPGVQNVQVSANHLDYVSEVPGSGRDGAPGRLAPRRLYFTDMVRVTIRSASGSELRVEVTLGDGSKLLLPPQQDARDTRALAGALARLGDFVPDPKLDEPDLPPAIGDPIAPPAPVDPAKEQALDEGLDQALEKPPTQPRDELGRDPIPVEEVETIHLRIRIMPGAQYTTLEDVKATGGLLLQSEGRGPDDAAWSFSGGIEFQILPELSLEANFRTSRFAGEAISFDSVYGWSGTTWGVTTVPSAGVGRVALLTTDLDLVYRFQFGWVTLGPRLGGRFGKVKAFYGPTTFQGYSARAQEGMLMIGASVDAAPFDFPVSFHAVVRGGANPEDEEKAQSVDARFEVRYLWEDLLGITVGYRYETLRLGKKTDFSPALGFTGLLSFDDRFEGVVHGPYLALVVQF